MFKKSLLILIVMASFVFAQTPIWKYKDGGKNVWDNWNDTGQYYEIDSYQADSLTSYLFAPNTRYHDFNGLLCIAVEMDTLTDATITTNGSLSFRLHFNDGIDWQESNAKLLLWKATDSSSTTRSLGDAQSGLKYYYLTDADGGGLENIPVNMFRLEMFWSDSLHAAVKATWLSY